MSASASRPRLRVGDWLLDTTSYEIERDGRRERLPHRLGRLLERLAREPGQVVPHAVLLTEVWPRPQVETDVLARAVADLRRALGDDPRAPRYIETIPKSGYRLVAYVAPARELPDDPTTAPDPARVERAPRPRPWVGLLVGVAVLAATAAVALWRHGAAPRLPRSAGPVDPLARERPLTSAPGYEIGPALSPDGTLVAYGEAAAVRTLPVLVVQAIDGTAQRRFPEPEGFYAVRPAFAPDGRRLAYLRRSTTTCEVYVRPLLAGDATRVAECSADVASSVSWTPDGAALVHTAPAAPGHGPGLSVVELAGGSVRTLTSPPQDQGADVDPRVAADGRRVAFARGADSDKRVMVLELAGPVTDAAAPQGIERALDVDPSRVTGLAWMPDGRALIVGSDALGYRALLRVDARGGAATLFGARGGQSPAFAANGDLAYELASYDANIWRLDLDRAGAEPVAVVRSTRYDGTPALAPDAARFAYVSTRDDQESVRVADIDAGNERRLPLDPATRWVLPAWSPDGSALLLTRYEGDSTSVYHHELASGRTTRLDALGPQAFAAQYLDDGSAIVYARRESPVVKSLWRIAATLDGAPEPLAPGVSIDRLQAGAGVVVYSRRDRDGVVVLPLDGTPSREILPEIGPEDRWNWCVAGRAVWFAEPRDDAHVLLRHDLDDGSTREVARGVEPSTAATALSVARDGTRVLFARVDEFSIDLMLAPGAGAPR